MKKLLAILVLISMPALAADYPRDIPLSWTNPITYTDDTPILEGDLKSIYLVCFRNNDMQTPAAEVEVPINPVVGSSQSHSIVDGAAMPGTYHCFAAAITVDDLWSDLSNEKTLRYRGKPLPPVVIN